MPRIDDESLTGTISEVTNFGPIIQVLLTVEDRLVSIDFDHRAFGWLLEGEGCLPHELVGRLIEYDGEIDRLSRQLKAAAWQSKSTTSSDRRLVPKPPLDRSLPSCVNHALILPFHEVDEIVEFTGDKTFFGASQPAMPPLLATASKRRVVVS